MVKPDSDVAAAYQALAGVEEHAELLFWGWKELFLQRTLVGSDLREEGEGEKGYSVGAEGGGLVDGRLKALDGLAGEAVDEIEVHTRKSQGKAALYRLSADLFALVSSNGFLHLAVKVLDAKADPRDAERFEVF